jgi:hypothetical protein
MSNELEIMWKQAKLENNIKNSHYEIRSWMGYRKPRKNSTRTVDVLVGFP